MTRQRAEMKFTDLPPGIMITTLIIQGVLGFVLGTLLGFATRRVAVWLFVRLSERR